MYRNTYAAIHAETLTENIRHIREYYPDYKYYFGVVKGNAYGHGMQAVNALIAGGVNYLATATLEEAEKVRSYNTDIPILCLEPVSSQFVADAYRLNVTLTVHRLDYLQMLIKTAPAGLKIHLKIDSGMNRLGFKSANDVEQAVQLIREDGRLVLEGIYTHLATSGLNDPYYDRQLATFYSLTAGIDLSAIPIVHIDRSLTLVHHKKADFINGTRLGICMYGFAQSTPAPHGIRKLIRRWRLRNMHISEPIFENRLQLKTALAFYTEIIDVKKVKEGEFVGYGASFIAPYDMTVATAAAGYYDGVSANLRQVCVNRKPCDIIGEMCMDMMLIEVPEETQVGDTVEIFGENIPISQAAKSSGLSAYRLLTGISARVPRIYEDKEYYL